MVLLASTLAAEIRKFTDLEDPSFVGFPASDAEAAAAWGDAIDVYTGAGLNIVPPILVPGAAALAKETMETGLLGLSTASTLAFDAAFLAYGLVAAPGMISGAVTAALPPVTSVSLSGATMLSVFAAGALGASAAVQADALASVIHAWFTTTSSFVAGGPAAPWS